MRVPRHVVDARRERLAALIQQRGYVPVSVLCAEFKISEPTARRDLSALAGNKQITRTFGGAVSEFNSRFPSFRQRQSKNTANKRRIAQSACKLIEPGWTCYLDAGTTIHALAEVLMKSPVTPLTIVTSSLPVCDILSSVQGIRLFLTGGELLPRQSVLLSVSNERSFEHWDFDAVFIGAEAADAKGLWNSQDSVVKQQQAAIRKGKRVIFCLDAQKFGRSANSHLANWSKKIEIVTDADSQSLNKAGVPASVQIIPA